MKRVTEPLKKMGAKIDGRAGGEFTPLSVSGASLKGIDYVSPVASAQIKSAVLLAGLQAEGTTTVTEPHKSRDHTERMLSAFGVKLSEDQTSVSIAGGQKLTAADIFVPGDISSAAFFLAAGAMVPNSRIVLKNVGLNPTRTGIIDVLQNMGAKLEIKPSADSGAEPYGDLIIETSSLKAVEIGGDIIPRLIDEIPIIALLATQAEGTTVIKDAAELKVKETNRIDTVVSELRKLGAEIEPTADGMKVYGKQTLKGGAAVSSHGDHRIGMMLGIASCITEEPIEIEHTDAIHVSYPTFFEHLNKLSKKILKFYFRIFYADHNSRRKNIACLIEGIEKQKGGCALLTSRQVKELLYCTEGDLPFSFSISRSFGKLIRLNNSLPYRSILFAGGIRLNYDKINPNK